MGAVPTDQSKPAATPVADLAEALVCAAIFGKAGTVAEPGEILEDLVKDISWAVTGLPSRGLADYDGVDLRLTPAGRRKASVSASPLRPVAEAEPGVGGAA